MKRRATEGAWMPASMHAFSWGPQCKRPPGESNNLAATSRYSNAASKWMNPPYLQKLVNHSFDTCRCRLTSHVTLT